MLDFKSRPPAAFVPESHSPAFHRGTSLLIVLVALALLSIAAVGLIRSVDTGNLIIGNLAFKQGTTSVSDRSIDSAVNWLASNNAGSTLFNSDSNVGYYSTTIDALDISGNSTLATRVLADWNNNNCAYAAGGSYVSCIKTSAPATNGDYTTQYLITRMCKTTGDPNDLNNNCAKPTNPGTNTSPKKGELKYGEDKRFTTQTGPYFRVIVRAVGPRNTVSYTESYVHF